MKKLKEILLLSNLKRVGKTTIYKKYWDILNENDNLDDLISEMEFNFSIPYSDLENAREKAENLYDYLLKDSNITAITVFDENYPERLNVMGDKRPIVLYIKGSADALYKPNISVIGTRKPSTLSEEFEDEIVRNIVNQTDRVVISGLALGCDKIAHQATVDENKLTVAVLPSGVNVIKPAKHKKLAQEIIKSGGCLISEYEPNKDAFKSTYVQRDQIVAALSDATFVVECGIKSGTMHTVDFSNEFNKKIYAFLPEDKQDVSFDGNEYILAKKNGIKVNNINNFIEILNDIEGDYDKDEDLDQRRLKLNDESIKTSQTLDFSKKEGQTTFEFI